MPRHACERKNRDAHACESKDRDSGPQTENFGGKGVHVQSTLKKIGKVGDEWICRRLRVRQVLVRVKQVLLSPDLSCTTIGLILRYMC